MRTTKKMAQQVNTRVTEELYRGLEKEASRRGLRIPDLVRWIIADYLVEVKDEDSIRSQGGQ